MTSLLSAVDEVGSHAVFLVKPARVDCWIYFALVFRSMCFRFHIFFLSFWYLDLYVLGDDASII